MPQETSLKEKLQLLTDWMPEIIDHIKRDLKNEHLKQDFVFIKKYLGGKNINKVTNEELSKAYTQAIQEQENGETIAEFIVHRWIFRNSEIYDFFDKHLSAISPDFTIIQELEPQVADKLMHAASAEFGATPTLIFSLLNDVRFPDTHFNKLRDQAVLETKQTQERMQHAEEKKGVENEALQHEQEIARLMDKYEKKLSGLQKKYVQDVEMLKKQVAHLQRKLASK